MSNVIISLPKWVEVCLCHRTLNQASISLVMMYAKSDVFEGSVIQSVQPTSGSFYRSRVDLIKLGFILGCRLGMFFFLLGVADRYNH